MHETIIGIDLGTTNSEVAVMEHGQIQVLDISPGKKILPSFVGLAEDGSILIGEAAKNQYPLYPERTVKSVKRLMGSNETIVLGEQNYTPQEISALILKQLKNIAEQHLEQAVAKAVITVPAYFSDAQRLATREAGEIAGLDVVRVLNEPTAAALSYEAGRQSNKRVLVYDLGGGTFDVSVVSMANDVVEVLSSHGNNQLGGDDFDAKIVDHLLAHLQEQGDDVSASRQAVARITRAAENAKIRLSEQPFFTVAEEYLATRADGTPINLSLELSRESLEEMITPFVDETLDAIHTALQGAGLAVADIDEVLLVGGATRTPLIRQRLENDLGLNVRTDVNPDLCVAYGAALQAATLAGLDVSAVLVDVTPYTFGTSALGEFNDIPYPYCFVPIIKKNTPIPVTRSEAFFTVQDNQAAVEVNIYQGEDRDALNNIQIGEFIVENLSKVPAGNTIILQLALDANGILQVSAREKNTGLEKSITINQAISQFEDGELTDARERIEQLLDTSPAAAPASEDSPSAHQPLRANAEKTLQKAQDLLDNVSQDDREDLIDMIETLSDALTSDDAAAIKTALGELSDILFYLES